MSQDNNWNNGTMVDKKNIQEIDQLAEPILPERLKHLRKSYLDPMTGKVGLTQEELAEKLGISLASVKKFEAAKNGSIPESKVLAKMCVLYNTELYFSPDPKLKHPVLLEREHDKEAQL